MINEELEHEVGSTVIFNGGVGRVPDGEYRITKISIFKNGVCVREEEEKKDAPKIPLD